MSTLSLPIRVAVLLSLCTSLWAQASLVNVASCQYGAYPATTCAIPSTGSGNLIVVAWAHRGSLATIGSITDNAGNTYVSAGTARAVNTSTQQMVDIWYATNSQPGATAVAVTPNPSGINGAGHVWEFSGVDTQSPLTAAAALNTQPEAALQVGASVTTTTPGEAVVTVLVPWATTILGLQSGDAFTADSLYAGLGWAHAIAGSPGTYAPHWQTDPAATFISSTVSFRPAFSGGGDGGPCDLTGDGVLDAADVQLATAMSLGTAPCTATIGDGGVCNVVVVQRVANAVLGGPCVSGSGAVPHSVTLNWLASASSNVVGYNTYRGTSPGGPYAKLNTTPVAETTYFDGSVQAGQTYYYVAKAVDNNSNESLPSNEAVAVVPSP